MKTPPTVVASPSARSARVTSSRPTRLSTISPVANTSPVVSTAVMSMTTIMDTIAARLNCGHPQQRQPDDQDHRPGDDRREVPDQPAEERCDHERGEARDDHRTVDHQQP